MPTLPLSWPIIRDRFAIEPRYAFQQIFLSPDRRGEAVIPDAEALLVSLSESDGAAADPTLFGDASLLPATMEPTALSAIDQVYGADFAAAVEGAVGNAWTGPVASAYGVHLIRIVSREGGPRPAAGRDSRGGPAGMDQRQARKSWKPPACPRCSNATT